MVGDSIGSSLRTGVGNPWPLSPGAHWPLPYNRRAGVAGRVSSLWNRSASPSLWFNRRSPALPSFLIH